MKIKTSWGKITAFFQRVYKRVNYNSNMKTATLVFLRRDEEILLTYKKRGFGKGKWNGPGGKVENEAIEEGAKREVLEEIGVELLELEHKAKLTFYDDGMDDWDVYVFLSWKFRGVPREMEEVKPKWFNLNSIPYKDMWEDDKYWLPRVLAGEKLRGHFFFNKGLEKLEHFILDKLE